MPQSAPIATMPHPTPSHADLANAIRFLSIDAVEQAKSGHPGMPMGMADVATILFTEFLNYDPSHPEWPNRDRFVLSAGHGSMLIYSLLYLTGYKDITLDEIKNFRQMGSKTAGHPEFGHAAGIETTTGPLGQGLANAVGMALAERLSAARFGDAITNHYTYAIAGDGCLMEGISHEAMALAGHLQLSKLIVLWDDNGITIDGKTDLSTSEDVPARARAYGWNTISIDGHNPEAIRNALAKAQQSDKPTLIACKTTIGYGAPTKAGTSATHGSPLGADEVKGAREKLGWSHAAFDIPDAILQGWRNAGKARAASYTKWSAAYEKQDEKIRELFERMVSGELPAGWQDAANALKKQICENPKEEATRKSSENVLNVLTAIIPEMIGGSADLTGSNNTKTKHLAPITKDNFSGSYIYYGIREHAMGAVMNGLALYGSFIPFGGTFLVFSDYCRPAIRLSALMQQRVIYVMTHDSIGLGEDGPTHQPIEHLASLRAIPNLLVFRPADAIETAECWALSLASNHAPSLLSLTRQNLPLLRTEYTDENKCARGGYVLKSCGLQDDVTLIATGSEVSIACEAADLLAKQNIRTRVVSMPCTELFDQQSDAYKKSVLPPESLRVSIEAASTFGWQRYTGERGINIGLDDFGMSAPYQEIYKAYGLTADAIAAKIQTALKS
jgi:transketolase